MAEVAAMARLWHRLPSEILHITDPYVAYWFDEAVFVHYCLTQQAQQAQSEEDPGTITAADIMALRGMGGVDINME